MRLIWIAVDPANSASSKLIEDIVQLVRIHGGRVHPKVFPDARFPGLDNGFSLGTRYCLNDIARAMGIRMVQVDVPEPD